MRMHTIEIDDEVLAYLKTQAEPLVDDANKVLRRLLLGGRLHTPRAPEPSRSHSPNGRMHVPAGTPMALREILEVVHRVRNAGSTRRDATRDVANTLNITVQSVLDKYTRQLGLSASQFDRLLDADRRGELKSLLKQRFPAHGEAIDAVVTWNRTSLRWWEKRSTTVNTECRAPNRSGLWLEHRTAALERGTPYPGDL